MNDMQIEEGLAFTNAWSLTLCLRAQVNTRFTDFLVLRWKLHVNTHQICSNACKTAEASILGLIEYT